LGFHKSFVIYDEQDQERHLKTVMKELDLDFKTYPPRAFLATIGKLKNDGITPDQYKPSQFNIFQKRLALVYQRYQENLRRNNALDFEDLLHFVAILFHRFPEVLTSYQDLCRYVMVDEFQDTNLIQYHLIRRLVERHQNICVVGDDDQSIYRWRGAEIGNILNFEKDFPKTKIITLEQNYRSTQNILQAANHVVRRNRFRKEKALWTENPEGELLTFRAAEDEAEEARFVVQKVLEQCHPSSSPPEGAMTSGRAYRDVAIFYRINAQSRPVEEELVKQQVPYVIVGGVKFYERKEIKDILAFLKLIANPSDGLSLKRIINIPPRGIGEKTLERIETLCREKGLTLYEGLKEALKEDWLSSATKTKIDAFIQMMEEFRKDVSDFSLSQLILSILTKTGYLDRLKEEGTDEALSRAENIDELVSGMMEFEHGEEEVSLETFLDKVSLVSDIDLYEDKGNRVSLMTLHCAKGLEFPVVFIVGMEEGLLPHYRRGEEIEDLEEERRLCYVGITRAKEKLFLSRAERRSTFGVGRANLPSRFLEELPSEMMDVEEPKPEEDRSWSEEPFADFGQHETNEPSHASDVFRNYREQELSSPPSEEWSLSPEGFYPLKIGMKVKHSKFGVGRVRSVEGMNEEQKATIIFQTVGVKRLKVAYAQLEILE
jgi:DNA helicase-2/ATP-dependent DNA helicase PcrA